MSSSNESQPPFESKSSYPPLAKPDFKPNVPPFLLDGASDQDKYIIEQLSLVNQYAQWSVNTELSTHEQVLKTNGRLIKAEKDIKDTKSEIESLKSQAKAVTPFLKPISMFSSLWEYTLFKWFFIGGVLFFLFVLYPWLLKIGLLELLDSFIRGN